jgi:hypothetical protein
MGEADRLLFGLKERNISAYGEMRCGLEFLGR